MYVRLFKRLFDALLAGTGLLVLALPIGGIWWYIHRKLGSPILFRQKRVGYQGETFAILKFRTMTAEGAVPGPSSAWLRATALDELPQLFNILRGQMSFVGPRPLIPEELRELDRVPDGRRRLSARPGLTGLAQLHSGKVPSLSERLRWDLAYVDHCSLPLDLQILFRSVAVTLRAAWENPGPKIPSGEA